MTNSIARSPAQATLLPLLNISPYRLSPNVALNIPKNPHFCCFVFIFNSFSSILFIKRKSSSDLITFGISFNSLFENINAVLSKSNFVLVKSFAIADAAAVNPKGNRAVLVKDLSAFPIKPTAAFINNCRSLPKNSPNCLIFNKQKFENFILALELFAKPLPIFKTCM